MPPIRKSISQTHHLRMRLRADVDFGIVTYRPGGKLGPRLQNNYQLVVIHQGSMRVTIDRKEILVGKGEGILLVPGTSAFFQFDLEKETTHSWCHLPARLLPTYFAFPPQCAYQPAPCSKWLLDVMKDCGRLPPKDPTRIGLHSQAAAVVQMMWHFCEAGFRLGGSNPAIEPEALLRVFRLISNRLGDPLTLADLAAAAAVSKGHLIKLARAHWSTTPMEKLWLIRLEEAARLLSQTGLGVAEVAYRTGFANPFHFSRRFKARFGLHPSAWQHSAWQPTPAVAD